MVPTVPVPFHNAVKRDLSGVAERLVRGRNSLNLWWSDLSKSIYSRSEVQRSTLKCCGYIEVFFKHKKES